MSLDSLFKQNNKKKNDADIADDQVSGEFRSRSEEDSLAASESAGRGRAAKSNKRPTNSRKNAPEESALPEKKRARRRLIGAVALVLAAIIVLPMVFDSEPKPGSQKISIEIPSKDTPLAATNPTRTATSSTLPSSDPGVVQGIDKSEEVVAAPVPSIAPVTPPKTPVAVKLDDTRNVVKVESATTQKVPEKNSDKKTEANAVNKTVAPNLPPVTNANKVTQDVVKKTEAKVDTKIEPKVESKAEAKKDNKDDAARALALLEGRALPADEIKNTAKPTSQTAPSAGSFTVQVAALNSPEKVRELQAKLKAASITSYTQKITTKTGEVSRIRVGPFSNKAEAEKMRAKLVKLGLNASVLPN